ncbi:Thymidylate synthase [Buchnera aphidicola (Tetraneura ulmi)]|uniref:thymidylate synthase n=1 Tax=Buchnera aphidicola TaxID=9 RepID=UPI003464E3C3
MKKYLKLLKKIINTGKKKSDRTGIGVLSIFGHHIRINLNKGFPLITTKKCHLPSIIHELLWFLKGDTNIKYLNENNISIWNEWADKKGNLGPIYGEQWRKWKTYNGKSIDQLQLILKEIINSPNSRRMLVSSWNTAEIPLMSIPPCHVLFQLNVTNKKLSCQIYQRSCDIFLGFPFNIASYALLTHMIAQQCKLKVGDLLWTGGDIHLYKNHLKSALIQLERTPKKLPNLIIKDPCPKSLFKYTSKHFKFENYNPYPHIPAEVAI